MRPYFVLPFIFGVLLCFGSPSQAQEKTDSRMQQILNPNPNRRFDLVYDKKVKGQGFNSPTGRVIETKNAQTKPFQTKGFLANAYRADKSYSQGASQYDVSETKKNRLSFLSWFQGKSYATKAARTKDYQDSSKKYNDAAAVLPTRDFRGKERDKMNKKLTQEQAANNGYKGDLREMKSIDDIRALLNKN